MSPRRKKISIGIMLLIVFAIAIFSIVLEKNIKDKFPKATPKPSVEGVSNPQEMPIKLMVVIYDPVIESQNNRKLHEVMGWNDPDVLTSQLISDFKQISHGVVSYQVVERIERDEWPIHTNGQRYTDQLYLQETAAGNWTLGSGNYNAIINDNQIAQKVNEGKVDEVFMWGFPGAGWWESAMAGEGAFWVNGGPISGVSSKAFILMGLNYERGMSEAMESYAHRTESIMRRIYGSWDPLETHHWNKFTLLDYNVSGRGGLGNAHNAFNAEQGTDYNRSSVRTLATTADDWYNFPNLTGATTNKNCTTWGCDGYQYFKWWYDHMPHVTGFTNGLLNNWWRYIADPNQYKSNWQYLPDAETDFSENNANSYSCYSEGSGATCSLSNDSNKIKSGSSSVKFITNGAFDTYIRYPSDGNASWDLTDKSYLTFWVYAINSSQSGFQSSSPQVYLRNSGGSYFKYDSGSEQYNSAIGSWKKITVPLAGGSGWNRTQSGTPSLADIDQIEVHTDTWDSGFTLYYDGMGFASGTYNDQISPNVSIVEPTNGSGITSNINVKINAGDNQSIFRVDLYLDNQYYSTDAVYPYIFNLTNLANGTHTLKAKAYDSSDNSSESQTVTVYNGSTPSPTPTPTSSSSSGNNLSSPSTNQPKISDSTSENISDNIYTENENSRTESNTVKDDKKLSESSNSTEMSDNLPSKVKSANFTNSVIPLGLVVMGFIGLFFIYLGLSNIKRRMGNKVNLSNNLKNELEE